MLYDAVGFQPSGTGGLQVLDGREGGGVEYQLTSFVQPALFFFWRRKLDPGRNIRRTTF